MKWQENRTQLRELNLSLKKIADVPRPFIKWVGGKRQLIPQLHKFYPKKFNKYIEPFIGGGAFFFYLLPEDAIIIDINSELINCYNVIKNNPDELIELLKLHRNEKEYFYEVRVMDRDNKSYDKLSDVERASRTMFLNKTCYNGLYRVNKSNQFNTPFGRYKNPKMCDEKNIKAVSTALMHVNIIEGDFSKVLDFAEKDDFIYFDSPYDPLNNTSNFTSYTKNSFNRDEQVRLASIFKQLDEIGCKILLSNSHTDFILDLYKDFKIHTVLAKRAINSNASKRGSIKEVLVTNFE